MDTVTLRRSGSCCLALVVLSSCTAGHVSMGPPSTNEPLGQSCTAASECASGFCASGVCCNQACNLPCQGCDFPGVAGICTTITDAEAPDCTGAYTCDDNGDCALAQGEACHQASDCASAYLSRAYAAMARAAADAKPARWRRAAVKTARARACPPVLPADVPRRATCARAERIVRRAATRRPIARPVTPALGGSASPGSRSRWPIAERATAS